MIKFGREKSVWPGHRSRELVGEALRHPGTGRLAWRPYRVVVAAVVLYTTSPASAAMPVTGPGNFHPKAAGAAAVPGKRASAAVTASVSVVGLLGKLAGAKHIRVILELPSSPSAMNGVRARLRGASSLSLAARVLGARPVVVHGITVLEPGAYPPLNEKEARYRAAMTGVAQFIEALPRGNRQALNREEWLDVRRIPAIQQLRITAAGGFSYWAGQSVPAAEHVAAGFIFDPYVQIEALGERGPRFFFRSWYRVPQYQRLVPSKTPGCVNAVFPRRPL